MNYQLKTRTKPLTPAYSQFTKTYLSPYLQTDMCALQRTCFDLMKLYYIEATSSLMIGRRGFFTSLLETFSTGQCGNEISDPWLWKFLPSIYKDNNKYEQMGYFSSILIDNSITWKEELIHGIELQYAYGNGHFRTFDQALYSKYQPHINPYRFDNMGFEGTTFKLRHLYQSFQYLLMGLILSWILFSLEEVCLASIKWLYIKSATRKKIRLSKSSPAFRGFHWLGFGGWDSKLG